MHKITHLECHKALKEALNINYNYHFLDVIFHKEKIEWHLAVQFKIDEKKVWNPRIVTFYHEAQKVSVSETLGGKDLWMDVQVLVAMGKPAGSPV